jgi:hypothetical protein
MTISPSLKTEPYKAGPLPTLPLLPGWASAAPAETMEDCAFQSGAALVHLHLVATDPAVPHGLWRDRLALAAAEVCAGFSGRKEGARAMRDALHLTRPGDDPGPAGAILRQWSRAVGRPISVGQLAHALERSAADRIATCLDAAGGTPVDRAARVIEAVLVDRPRAETEALILADAVLAKSLGWDHVLPILWAGLKPRDLRLQGDALRMACHRAVVLGARQAVLLAADLARASARLRSVAPRVRAKGVSRAVDLFLSRDALAPGALDFMSDRAARRLCSRLVELGALRELTGRETFRLYGV